MLVKYINACFTEVATMSVRCLCVRLSGISCPDYNTCFEALSLLVTNILYATCTPWPSTDGQIQWGKLTISCCKGVEHTGDPI